MEIDGFFDWLQGIPIAVAMRENDILFPWIESFHVLAIVLVVGTILIVDLRLIGVASRNRALTLVLREVLPYTWIAFAVAAVTGSLLFASNATKYAHNVFFQAKMMLLLIAACNMAIFHLMRAHEYANGHRAEYTALAARTAGTLSLVIWVTLVACGRWIGFTLH
jgi:cytochrome bd-type quinol oxidase subunit 2